ncbi:hypothetical protein EK21DRAFT_107230 [Setomelanomma holmii]|uniref:Uncharacterized protein n=1 Tax=Setomelanomma holmii TaxID=210430 RepID=A0A9P4LS49_9PLEO|nr:hypothetical protein EK21DRAFT_107230 [Setomelanomma holmii]
MERTIVATKTCEHWPKCTPKHSPKKKVQTCIADRQQLKDDANRELQPSRATAKMKSLLATLAFAVATIAAPIIEPSAKGLDAVKEKRVFSGNQWNVPPGIEGESAEVESVQSPGWKGKREDESADSVQPPGWKEKRVFSGNAWNVPAGLEGESADIESVQPPGWKEKREGDSTDSVQPPGWRTKRDGESSDSVQPPGWK